MSFLTVSNEEEQSWGGGGVFRTAGSLLSPDVLLLFLCWVIPGAPPNWHAHTELLGRQTVLMRHSRLFPGRTMDFELKTVFRFHVFNGHILVWILVLRWESHRWDSEHRCFCLWASLCASWKKKTELSDPHFCLFWDVLFQFYQNVWSSV